MKFEFNVQNFMESRGLTDGRWQRFMGSECVRLMAPYTPFRSGALIGSARVGADGTITQQTPYAARWYYTPANFNGAPERGNFWFERMLEQGGAEIIGTEVAQYIGATFKK